MITTHFEEKHSNQNVTCCCECLEIIPKGSNRLRRHILKSHHSATGIEYNIFIANLLDNKLIDFMCGITSFYLSKI